MALFPFVFVVLLSFWIFFIQFWAVLCVLVSYWMWCWFFLFMVFYEISMFCWCFGWIFCGNRLICPCLKRYSKTYVIIIIIFVVSKATRDSRSAPLPRWEILFVFSLRLLWFSIARVWLRLLLMIVEVFPYLDFFYFFNFKIFKNQMKKGYSSTYNHPPCMDHELELASLSLSLSFFLFSLKHHLKVMFLDYYTL